jgi:YceI-like domain
MKKYILCVMILFAFQQFNAQIFMAKNVNVRIFSASPIENIEAKSNLSSCAFSLKNGKMIMKVPIKSFKFDKALMQEHFNENYMESEKYPMAVYEGVLQDLPDLTKNGEYNVKVKGKLTLHGVTLDREYTTHLSVKNGDIKGTLVFKVKCKDHNIVIPKVVAKNIAEEIEISVSAEFKSVTK